MLKTRDEIEGAIGRRIRSRRQEKGLSQAELAAACGISFQQIQKYERGANRICVSRLMQIARALDAPAVELLGEMDGAVRPLVTGAVMDPQARALAEAFSKLQSRKLRRTLLNLAQVLLAYDRADDDHEIRSPGQVDGISLQLPTA